jgi:uncharacterized protein YndB with AHSA1/START domain
MTQSIVVRYDLPSPPAKVWRALTEPALVARWLMANDLAPIVGHRFTFRAPPMHGWDGVVHCEVTAVEPERLLRYTWVGGGAEHRLDSVVTWTLAPTATGGTHLALEHAGFTANNAMALDAMTKGWTEKIRGAIEAVLAAAA